MGMHPGRGSSVRTARRALRWHQEAPSKLNIPTRARQTFQILWRRLAGTFLSSKDFRMLSTSANPDSNSSSSFPSLHASASSGKRRESQPFHRINRGVWLWGSSKLVCHGVVYGDTKRGSARFLVGHLIHQRNENFSAQRRAIRTCLGPHFQTWRPNPKTFLSAELLEQERLLWPVSSLYAQDGNT